MMLRAVDVISNEALQMLRLSLAYLVNAKIHQGPARGNFVPGDKNISRARVKTCNLLVRYHLLDLCELAFFLASNWILRTSQPFTLICAREIFQRSKRTSISQMAM